jgi:hypothetical protein
MESSKQKDRYTIEPLRVDGKDIPHTHLVKTWHHQCLHVVKFLLTASKNCDKH